MLGDSDKGSFIAFSVAVVLRSNVQQLEQHLGVQEQRGVRDQQEEPDVVQSVPPEEVPDGGHVQERLALRTQEQLVQDTLPPPGAAEQQQREGRPPGQGGPEAVRRIQEPSGELPRE